MKHWIPLVLTFAAASGCSKGPEKEWLAGAWVPLNESCDSHSGYKFDLTGQFSSWDHEGIWDLTGDNIEISITGKMDHDKAETVNVDQKKKLQLKLFKDNYFEIYNEGYPEKWKRCQFAEIFNEGQALGGVVSQKYQQMIIWEFTGGFYTEPRYLLDYISSQCQKRSANLNAYLNDGWRIVSSSPSKVAINGGQCDGRDIIIERG